MSAPGWLGEARALKMQGWSQARIASCLGVPRQRVSEWLNAKPCRDCQTLINQRHERCASCNRAAQVVWTREAIIAAMRAWAAEYGEPPACADWNQWAARHGFHDEQRAERHKQGNAEGKWPWFDAVVKNFGSWNLAIEAAGFTPRAVGGGQGNSARRRASGAKGAVAG